VLAGRPTTEPVRSGVPADPPRAVAGARLSQQAAGGTIWLTGGWAATSASSGLVLLVILVLVILDVVVVLGLGPRPHPLPSPRSALDDRGGHGVALAAEQDEAEQSGEQQGREQQDPPRR